MRKSLVLQTKYSEFIRLKLPDGTAIDIHRVKKSGENPALVFKIPDSVIAKRIKYDDDSGQSSQENN